MTKKPMTIEDLAQLMDKQFKGVNERFDGVDKRFEGLDKQFKGVNERFDGVDKRFDAVGKQFEGVNERFKGLDKRFDGVDKRFMSMDERFDSVEQKIEDEVGNLAAMSKREFDQVHEVIGLNSKQIEFLRKEHLAHDFKATEMVHITDFSNHKADYFKLEERVEILEKKY